jgi:hypothetical protein
MCRTYLGHSCCVLHILLNQMAAFVLHIKTKNTLYVNTCKVCLGTKCNMPSSISLQAIAIKFEVEETAWPSYSYLTFDAIPLY